MKRISVFAICFAVAAVIVSLVAKPTRWAARSVWSSVSQPLDKEYGYYDAYRLVLDSNRKDLAETDGGKLLIALTAWDDLTRLRQLAAYRKQMKDTVTLDALIAGRATLDGMVARQAVHDSIQNGKALDPDNAFWDLCEWQLHLHAKEYDKADRCLHSAAGKAAFDNHHREAYAICSKALQGIVGKKQFLDSETAFFTRPGQFPRSLNQNIYPKSEWKIQRRYDAIRAADLVVRNTDWSLRPLEYRLVNASLLRLTNEAKKLTENEKLANAAIIDTQAKEAGISDSRFSVLKVFQDQAATKSKPSQARFLPDRDASTAFFDRLSAANQAAAALALSIPIFLLFILGQRLRQHPGLAISLPLAAMAAAFYALNTHNEHLTIQCLSLLVASVGGLFPAARKWLWLAAIPLAGSAALCWALAAQGPSEIYKPVELVINATAATVGLAICLPKMPERLSLALSVIVVGGVLVWMSRAWSVLGILSTENTNWLALASIAGLALVAPKTRTNPQAMFATVLIAASAAYIAFILRFASSP